MAFMNIIEQGQSNAMRNLHAAAKRIRVGYNRRKVFLRTMDELNAMTDRDLADLGITRSQFAELAWQEADKH